MVTYRYKIKGFTIVEILVVISIAVMIFAILMTGISNYAARQQFKTVVTDARDGIIEMRQNTLASVNDTLYGVHVSSTAVVLFPGSDFVEGNAANTVITFPNAVTATPSFTGGVQTATFTRLTGVPSATGTIVFFDTASNATDTITISATGLVQ